LINSLPSKNSFIKEQKMRQNLPQNFCKKGELKGKIKQSNEYYR